MRKIRLRSVLTFFPLMLVHAWAGQPTPFVTLFRRADTIVVGSIESIKRTSDAAILAKTAPQEPLEGAPAHPCEVTIRIAAVLKSPDAELKEGTLHPVIWYTPDVIPCHDGSLGFDTEVSNPRLWLLRTENGILRYVVDKDPSSRTLQMFSPEVKRGMEEWKDPALETEYLLLKPGVRSPENQYARLADDEAMSLIVGSSNYLKIYRAIYLESNDYVQGQISLKVASMRQCLDSARRTAKAEGQLSEWEASTSLLRPEIERRNENDLLGEMRHWTSKQQMLERYHGDDNAERYALYDLTLWACSSMPRVKARARQLLRDFFGVDPSTLPCIPCE